jgi:hypothetical protein
LSNKDPVKVTLPEDDEGVSGGWVLFRGKGERFKAGERRALYEYHDGLTVGDAVKNLMLARRMALHLIRDWSFEQELPDGKLVKLPVPSAVMTNGTVSYENAGSLDELECGAEDEILGYAAQWVKQIAINFGASKDPESPTVPSGA